MRKLLLLLIFVISMLNAAEIRDGTLYLEINLATAPKLELQGMGIILSEDDHSFKNVIQATFPSRLHPRKRTTGSESSKEWNPQKKQAITKQYLTAILLGKINIWLSNMNPGSFCPIAFGIWHKPKPTPAR